MSIFGSPTASVTDSWKLFHNFIDLLLLHRTLQGLRESGTSATLTRLFVSKHVRDLKLIAGIACWLILSGILFILLLALFSIPSLFYTVPYVQAAGKWLPTISAIVAVSGAVVAWVYRTSSVRLGVVDLFASEIMTLCRVGTTVDMVQHSIGALKCVGPCDNSKGSLKVDHYVPHNFTSQEEYFPVFSTNSRDLEVLEADVVTNVTAFYTYMKVVRDYLRRVGEIRPNVVDLRSNKEWRETWRNIIYMQFLAYETARKAIDDLIEYEPRHVENTIIILLTEVVAYCFLLENFENDFRSARLELRLPQYRKTVTKLEIKLRENVTEPKRDNAEWEKAIELWPDLRDRLKKLDIEVGKLR